jgi:hypothetical protein
MLRRPKPSSTGIITSLKATRSGGLASADVRASPWAR